MHGSVFDYPAFRPVPLILFLLAAAALYGGWSYNEAVRAWWDAADVAVFRGVNETLRHAAWWRHVWAIGNNHFFDFVSILLMLWLLFRYITAEERAYVTERVAVALTIALTIGVSAIITNRVEMDKRFSPSAVLPDPVMLTDYVHWLPTKDISYNSFPSDHATVLLIMALMLWHFSGRKAGLIMLGGAVLFTFPRVIGGAHWFTDITAGSIPLALTLVALCIFTPLHRLIMHGFMRILRIPFLAACVELGTHPDAPTLVGKGCCVGAADIVPGVSGGTVAYILGIWYRLMEAIKSFDVKWFKLLLSFRLTEALRHAHFVFVIPRGVGVGLSIITFTRFIPIPTLLQTHPEPIYGLFFGLIAGSVVLLLHEAGKLSLKDAAILAAGVVAGWLVVNIVPVQTPETWWFLVFCGALAISAMLLPGISGSFVLLILGKYAYVLGGVGALDFSIIIPFAAGCLFGLVTFSRVASWVLHHYYRISVLAIIGVLIGSLWMIWPFQERIYETVRGKERLLSSSPIWPQSFGESGQLGLIFMAAGFALVIAIGVYALHKRRSQKAAEEAAEAAGLPAGIVEHASEPRR